VAEDGALVVGGVPGSGTGSTIRVVAGAELPPAPPDRTSMFGSVPKEYALAEPYPNPFNPAATIRYQLPTESRVRMTVYSVLGGVVERLVDGVVPAGYHEVVWNASTVSGGIYFCRMESSVEGNSARPFSQVRKLLLVK
jgi:hypothetical protein